MHPHNDNQDLIKAIEWLAKHGKYTSKDLNKLIKVANNYSYLESFIGSLNEEFFKKINDKQYETIIENKKNLIKKYIELLLEYLELDIQNGRTSDDPNFLLINLKFQLKHLQKGLEATDTLSKQFDTDYSIYQEIFKKFIELINSDEFQEHINGVEQQLIDKAANDDYPWCVAAIKKFFGIRQSYTPALTKINHCMVEMLEQARESAAAKINPNKLREINLDKRKEKLKEVFHEAQETWTYFKVEFKTFKRQLQTAFKEGATKAHEVFKQKATKAYEIFEQGADKAYDAMFKTTPDPKTFEECFEFLEACIKFISEPQNKLTRNLTYKEFLNIYDNYLEFIEKFYENDLIGLNNRQINKYTKILKDMDASYPDIPYQETFKPEQLTSILYELGSIVEFHRESSNSARINKILDKLSKHYTSQEDQEVLKKLQKILEIAFNLITAFGDAMLNYKKQGSFIELLGGIKADFKQEMDNINLLHSDINKFLSRKDGSKHDENKRFSNH